ncbi:MAG TPA: O-antigen ligase family protein [Gammaproteobacteria bacterium]|nr:O-antigen ligase family protein [Gammaproteobacteria bacterium]
MLSKEVLPPGKLLTLPNFLVFTYTLFLTGFYYIPNAVDQYKFYSIAVFLPGLFILKPALRELKGNILWYAILAYLCYMLLTSLWSIDFSAKQLFRDARLGVYIMMFILLTVFIARLNRKLLDTIIRLTCIVAGIAATISIFLWYSNHPFPSSRLIGIGTIGNPNPSAFIYGFFAVFACYYAFRAQDIRTRLAFALICMVLLAFVALTRSNTGILATATAIPLLLIAHTHHHRLLLVGGTLTGIGAVVYLLGSLGALSGPTDSGFTERLIIWEKVLDQGKAAPAFGNGYQKEILMTSSGGFDKANYAHNTFLASLRDGGITGLLLHLFIMAIAIRIAVQFARKNRDPIYLILLVFGFICMSADTDQLITRPRELWVIFWLPLALLAGLEVEGRQRSASRQAG